MKNILSYSPSTKPHTKLSVYASVVILCAAARALRFDSSSLHRGSMPVVGLVARGPKRAVSAEEIHVAVVYSACCVHVVVAASDRMGLQRQLGDYVGRHADVQLFGGDAERVHSLLNEEAIEEAVRLYFALVGERWDREWLEERIVQLPV